MAYELPYWIDEFATGYARAWCSQNAASVAAYFTEDGSLRINDGAPSIGRGAITAAAQGFMTAFPDLVVTFDRLELNGPRVNFHWTLTGTNTGPGGTGKSVSVSGWEEWLFSDQRLIKDSLGHFDGDDYQRQLGREN